MGGDGVRTLVYFRRNQKACRVKKSVRRRQQGIMGSRNRANLAANIILFTAVAIFTVFLVRHMMSNHDFTKTSLSSDGERVSISGIDLSPFQQAVIVVLDKNCRFCKQQTPFYRRLAESSRAKNIKLVFAFPH